MIYACKFWFLKIDSILYSFQKCEYSYIDDKWWNWWSAFPDCIKLEFPLTAFSTGCNFVLLLFKEEQRYFPPFPSTKHPLGMFPSPFLSFLAPRPLIPSVGNTTCQTAQAPMLIITQDKKKKLMMGNASFRRFFFLIGSPDGKVSQMLYSSKSSLLFYKIQMLNETLLCLSTKHGMFVCNRT